MCSKHVETWNKLIVKQNFCAPSWLITEINILRCSTVSKTSHSQYVTIISFPPPTVVARTHLNVTSYVLHCMSCYNWDVNCLLRGTSWVFIYNSNKFPCLTSHWPSVQSWLMSRGWCNLWHVILLKRAEFLVEWIGGRGAWSILVKSTTKRRQREDSVTLRYDGASIANRIPMFRGNVLFLHSRVDRS